MDTSSLSERLFRLDEGMVPCRYTKRLWSQYAPIIEEIHALKQRKKAIILAHTYVVPEIIYGVADFVGDSYQLSLNAKETQADIIVFAAVRFMAETAKILNPSKQVLIPSSDNGCTLADSITSKEVVALRKQFPHHTFVGYINTSAEVKAACDVTVTSSNVIDIIKHLPTNKIYFLPDELMGHNVIRDLKDQGIHKDIQLYKGRCYVHEAYQKKDLRELQKEHPNVKIVAHPECNSDVAEASDFVGSTSQMMRYIEGSRDDKFFVLSECGLSARLQLENPDKHFIGTCHMCRYMKSNTLMDILRVLKHPKKRDIIHIKKDVQQQALASLDKMFYYANIKDGEKPL